MRIALVSDIHANWPALKAVLAHADSHDVSAIWNLGDILGYNVFPQKVVRRLAQDDVVNIIGNFDQKVLRVKRKALDWIQTKDPNKYLAYEWAYDNLSKKDRQFLKGLPNERRLIAAGKQILLTHGSPSAINESLLPGTPMSRFKELVLEANADIVVCGHSHLPLKRKVNGTWFINPGSVGRPIDGDPRAAYAVMHLKRRYFRVYFYRVEYDVDRAVDAIVEQQLPPQFAEMVRYGRNLKEVGPPKAQLAEPVNHEAPQPIEEVLVPPDEDAAPHDE